MFIRHTAGALSSVILSQAARHFPFMTHTTLTFTPLRPSFYFYLQCQTKGPIQLISDRLNWK